MIVNQHGSKENSAAEIISYFPRDYSTLIVPFFGGGRLSYHVLRRNKSKYVIANDINNDVYSFWMCVKFQPERFMKEVEELLIHSELFKKWAGEKNRVEFVKFISGMSEDDQILWKAIRFYMLNQFGSFCKGTSTIKMESKAPKEVLNNSKIRRSHLIFIKTPKNQWKAEWSKMVAISLAQTQGRQDALFHGQGRRSVGERSVRVGT